MAPAPRRYVLVVEDEASIAQAFTDALRLDGYEVTAVESGVEALIAMERRVPDLLLLDLRLPGVSGPALLHELRQRARLAHVPVVVVSAARELVDLAPRLGPQVRACLAKPLDLEVLLGIVERLTAPRPRRSAFA